MAYTNINGIQFYVDIFTSLLNRSSSRHIQMMAELGDTVLSLFTCTAGCHRHWSNVSPILDDSHFIMAVASPALQKRGTRSKYKQTSRRLTNLRVRKTVPRFDLQDPFYKAFGFSKRKACLGRFRCRRFAYWLYLGSERQIIVWS
jgi:hypothetical protein